MKAWLIWDSTDDDVGQDVVWSDNIKEAKSKGQLTYVGQRLDRYIDLRVRRAPEFDDMENLPTKDFRKIQWERGWYWYDAITPLPHYGELSDDERDKVWDEWYKENFEKWEKRINNVEGCDLK